MTLTRGVVAMCAAQACAQIGTFSVAALIPMWHRLLGGQRPIMKRAFSRVAAPRWRQAARDAAMREKGALNEAGWRVGIPLAFNVD